MGTRSYYHLRLDGARRHIILSALEVNAGSRTKAAEYLGMRRSALGALISRVGLAAEVQRRWPPRSGPAARKN